MIVDAQKEFSIDLLNSILVGDKNSDIEAGIKSGIATCYLITTGHNIEENIFNVKVLNNLRELI